MKTFKQFCENLVVWTQLPTNPAPKKTKPKEHPMVKQAEKKDNKQ